MERGIPIAFWLKFRNCLEIWDKCFIFAEKLNYMKKLLFTLIVLVWAGCSKQKLPLAGNELVVIEKDTSVNDSIHEPVIQEVIEWMNQGKFTSEEVAYWDSMGNEGCLFIRDAERYLDTIINHMHIVSIPEP